MQLLVSKSSINFNQKRLVHKLKNGISSLQSKLHLWRERSRQRKALTQLSPYLLKDIGVSRSDAMNEVQKPFWKP